MFYQDAFLEMFKILVCAANKIAVSKSAIGLVRGVQWGLSAETIARDGIC
jgi:hypothetical protein